VENKFCSIDQVQLKLGHLRLCGITPKKWEKSNLKYFGE
jgi:hypothetical protein